MRMLALAAALSCALAPSIAAPASAQVAPLPPVVIVVGPPAAVPQPWVTPAAPPALVWTPQQGWARPPAPPLPLPQPSLTLPPPRRHRPIGLLVAGAAALGAGWVSNAIVGQFAGVSSAEPGWSDFRLESLVPVLGPWLQLMSKPTGFEEDDWGRWLIVDGIAQAAGLALLIAAIGRWGSGPDADEDLELDPLVGPGVGGAMLSGRF